MALQSKRHAKDGPVQLTLPTYGGYGIIGSNATPDKDAFVWGEDHFALFSDFTSS